jgi:polar amino acid transport system permease protein
VFGSEIVSIYGVELVFYLLLAVAITVVLRALERAAAKRLGRKPPDRAKALARATAGGV